MIRRDYQDRAIKAVYSAYGSGSNACCLVAPTGSGKSFMGAEVALGARQNGADVVWLVHRDELVDQAGEALLGCGFPVVTVQSLLASGDRPPADLLVLDEAHHYAADQWGAVARHYAGARVLGLTATPERSDGRPLGDLFDSMVVAASYSELLSAGHLAPCEVFRPPTKGKALAMSPADAWRTYGRDRSTIVFCATVAEAQSVADELVMEAGARCVDGCTHQGIRRDVVDAFRSGACRVVTNVYVFTEGFDAPRAEVCILARGCSHVSTYLQIAGRVLRTHPGKTRATLIDLTGASWTHGLPTEDREYSLDGSAIRAAGSRPDSLWQCKHCGFCIETQPANRLCPHCGKRMPLPEALLIKQRKLEKARHVASASNEEKRDYWQGLQATAAAKGYKSGWAYYRFRGRYGHNPPA